MIAGYYVALERTLFFDHVDDESLRLWEINVEVHEEGMKLIKTGVACKDIALELIKSLQNTVYLKVAPLAMAIHLECCHTTTVVRQELNCAKISTLFCKKIWSYLWNR